MAKSGQPRVPLHRFSLAYRILTWLVILIWVPYCLRIWPVLFRRPLATACSLEILSAYAELLTFTGHLAVGVILLTSCLYACLVWPVWQVHADWSVPARLMVLHSFFLVSLGVGWALLRSVLWVPCLPTLFGLPIVGLLMTLLPVGLLNHVIDAADATT